MAGKPKARSTASDKISGTEDGKHLLLGLRSLQFLAALLIAEESRERRQRLKVALELALRGEEQNAQSHRLPVERLKINWRIEPGHDCDHVLNAGDARVRNCDAVADAGSLCGLAILQSLANGLPVLGANLADAHEVIDQRVDQSPTIRRRHFRHDLFRAEDVREVHRSLFRTLAPAY